MLRPLTAAALFAFASAALACDDAGHSHKSAMAVDDGVPASQPAATPAKASAKEAKAVSGQTVKTEAPAAKRRTPAGKPLAS